MTKNKRGKFHALFHMTMKTGKSHKFPFRRMAERAADLIAQSDKSVTSTSK